MLCSHWTLAEIGVATLLGLAVPLLGSNVPIVFGLTYVSIGMFAHWSLGVWRWNQWRRAIQAHHTTTALAELERQIADHHALRVTEIKQRQLLLLDLVNESQSVAQLLDESLEDDHFKHNMRHLKNCARAILDPGKRAQEEGAEYWTVVEQLDLIDITHQAHEVVSVACPDAAVSIDASQAGVLQVPWRSGSSTLVWCLARIAIHFADIGAKKITFALGAEQTPYVKIGSNVPLALEHRRGMDGIYGEAEDIARLPGHLQRVAHYLSASGVFTVERSGTDGLGHEVDCRFLGDLPEHKQLRDAARIAAAQAQGVIH